MALESCPALPIHPVEVFVAYFQRRRGKQVTVYYWDAAAGKQARLSRAESRHLDELPDDEVRSWLAAWEKDHGREVRRVLLGKLAPTDPVAKLRDAALADWQLLRPIRANTLEDYRRYFDHAVAFFIGKHSLQDVRKWAAHVPAFPAFLRVERELGVDAVKQVCRNLLRFGRYLVKQRVLAAPWYLEAPKTGRPAGTPLPGYMTEQEVVAYARSLPAPWCLVPLLCYGGPLRPEECFALEKSDFLTGAEAAAATLTHKRLAREGLGSRLSISIDKTIVGPRVDYLTKTHYAAGVANMWSAACARAAAEVLRDLPEGRVFPGGRDGINKQYRDAVGAKGWGAKDWSRLAGVEFRLRDIRLELAKDQFRHSNISTTQRYMRIPPGLIKEARGGKQDFDDVG